MRPLLLAFALLACGASKRTGPAWPEPSKTAEDGGESLEPRPSATYAAAIETADEEEAADEKAVEPKPDDKPAADKAAEDKPAEKSDPQAPAGDEVIMTEEIIIEIEE